MAAPGPCRGSGAARWLWAVLLALTAANALADRSMLQTSTQCTSTDKTDFWGADITKMNKIASTAACCAACSAEAKCNRWTYAPNTKSCWLKRASGWIQKANTNRVSGVVVRGSSGVSTVSPSPPPSPSPAPAPSTPSAPLSPISADGTFTKANYADVLGLSWLFYEAQRSGALPNSGYRIPWRKSAHTPDVVPGGWYDAGDYLKLNYPMASAATYLAWGLLEFRQGYQEAGQTQHALNNLYVAADYLKRCHIAPSKYIGQIGHPDTDHSFWGRADQQKTARPAYVYNASMGASDLMGKVAAALASSSIVWRDIAGNPAYAADLLDHARDVYALGKENEGKYSRYYKSATASIYPSSDWADDMAWGAYWLYRATGNRDYLEDSVAFWKRQDWDVTADWDNSGAAVAVALANLVEDGVAVPNSSDIKTFVVDEFLTAWTQSNGYLEIMKTPKGMSRPKWSSWGNLHLSTTASFLALAHAKHTKTASTRTEAIAFARSQIDYALGSSGRSFVVGFGKNYPQHCHHAGASCPDRPGRCDWSTYKSDDPNPQVLHGAMVGGPEGPGDNTYRDSRTDYVSNEVSVSYNAGFTSALAGLVAFL